MTATEFFKLMGQITCEWLLVTGHTILWALAILDSGLKAYWLWSLFR